MFFLKDRCTLPDQMPLSLCFLGDYLSLLCGTGIVPIRMRLPVSSSGVTANNFSHGVLPDEDHRRCPFRRLDEYRETEHPSPMKGTATPV